MNPDFLHYNKQLTGEDAAICETLLHIISENLPNAESKIWHAHPVWFIDGNPIVGYHKLKNCIRVLFWSGQSFEESELVNEGSFKAAEKRYNAVSEIQEKDLKRWLKKSQTIQWDYKNIVKRRGVLERLK